MGDAKTCCRRRRIIPQQLHQFGHACQGLLHFCELLTRLPTFNRAKIFCMRHPRRNGTEMTEVG